MSALAATIISSVALSVAGVLAEVAFGKPFLGDLPYIITPANSGYCVRSDTIAVRSEASVHPCGLMADWPRRKKATC